jgi:hypothetical protein
MLLQHEFPFLPSQAVASGTGSKTRPGRRLTLLLSLTVAVSLGTTATCRAGGLVVEAPTLDGLLPGSTGSFDILLMNTNSPGGASFNVASDNLDISLVGGPGITITNASFSTSATYIFAQSIDKNFGLPFATINAPPTSFTSNDAGDFAAGYPGFQLVSPGQTYGLAHVTYALSSSVAPGTDWTISINGINVGTSLSDDQGNSLSITAVNGSLGVLFVPEPATLIQGTTALLIGLAACGWRRRSAARSSAMRPTTAV